MDNRYPTWNGTLEDLLEYICRLNPVGRNREACQASLGQLPRPESVVFSVEMHGQGRWQGRPRVARGFPWVASPLEVLQNEIVKQPLLDNGARLDEFFQ